MPREVLEVLSLDDLEGIAGPMTGGQGTGKVAKRSDSGYVADSAVRRAIEWRAVNLATEAYEALGYEVDYTGSAKPYDLVVKMDQEVRRVEVKGSSGLAKHVELTYGEVDNSRDWQPTDLYVVDGIHWWRESDGSVQADGGDARWWTDWTATDTRLKSIRFRYKLPSGGNT